MPTKEFVTYKNNDHQQFNIRIADFGFVGSQNSADSGGGGGSGGGYQVKNRAPVEDNDIIGESD